MLTESTLTLVSQRFIASITSLVIFGFAIFTGESTYFKISEPKVGRCGTEPFCVDKIMAMHWLISSIPSEIEPI